MHKNALVSRALPRSTATQTHCTGGSAQTHCNPDPLHWGLCPDPLHWGSYTLPGPTTLGALPRPTALGELYAARTHCTGGSAQTHCTGGAIRDDQLIGCMLLSTHTVLADDTGRARRTFLTQSFTYKMAANNQLTWIWNKITSLSRYCETL